MISLVVTPLTVGTLRPYCSLSTGSQKGDADAVHRSSGQYVRRHAGITARVVASRVLA